MIPFNWLDVLLAILLLSSVITGLRMGFARVVVGLIAAVVGFLAAFWCYRMAAGMFLPWLATPALANIAGFLLIFLGILLLGSIIAAVLSRLLKWVGLSWFNHLLGGAAGLLRGALVIAVLVDAAVAFTPSPPPDFLNQSRLLPYATQLSSWLADAAPRELKDAFDAQMQTIKQFWISQRGRHRAQEI